MLRGVFFDMDGTIADSLQFCYRAFQIALEPFLQQEVSIAELVAVSGITEEGMLRRLVPSACYEEARQRWYDTHRRLHAAMNPAPIPGMSELLHTLHDHAIPLALITGRGETSLSHSLDQFDMHGLFGVVETGDLDRSKKTECLLRAAAKLCLSPTDVVYVGDSPGDIASAHEAGMSAAAALYASPEFLQPDAVLAEHPEHSFYRVADLADYLYESCGISKDSHVALQK